MKERIQALSDKNSKIEAEFAQLRDEVKAAIMALPDNPAIKRVGSSPRCYTISSSELFARDNWTAQYHDFKTQYQKLCDVMDAAPVRAAVPRLLEVLAKGYIDEKGGRFKLHPDVVKNVAKLLEA